MLSIPHLIVILLIALIVLGPEKLPEVARTLSKAMIEFRRATGGLRETFEQELRQLEREVNEAANPTPARVPPPSAPALEDDADAAAGEGVPSEEAAEPAYEGEFTAAEEDPFRAESSEDVTSDEQTESPTAAEAAPGKPTDGHSTAA